jgi:predicted Zn-dependent protease
VKISFLLALLIPAALHAHPDPSHTLAELDAHLIETPDDQETLRRKAELLLDTGNPAAASPVIGRLLVLDARHADNLLLDARLAYAKGAKDESKAKARSLLNLKPEHAEAWNFLSRLEEEGGHRDAAIAAKRRYLGLTTKPGPSDVLTCAAWLNERHGPGDDESALAILDAGLARLGCLSGLHYAAIPLELELGLHDSALRRIDVLVARYRPSVDLAMRRAQILEHARRYKEAAEACDSAIALLDALPSARKRNAAYQEVLADISKRKADNLLKAGGN